MRVIGAIAILLAAFLGLGAYESYDEAYKLRKELAEQDLFTRFVGDVTGLNQIDLMKIQHMEDEARRLAIAAGVVGILGLMFCASGDNKS